MSNKTRKELSLADKIKVISDYEKSGTSLADEYRVGKTQIQQTIKRKAEYMTAYEDTACSCRKRLCTSTSITSFFRKWNILLFLMFYMYV